MKIIKALWGIIIRARLIVSEWLLPKDFYAQQNPNFNYVLNFFPDFLRDSRQFNQESNRTGKKLLRDGNRWLLINLLIDTVKRCSKGDYAELGTYKGLSARLIWNRKVQDAKFYCFDTFEGFNKDDVKHDLKKFSIEINQDAFSDTSESLVRKNITKDKNNDQLILRKGYFPKTFTGLEHVLWRFVHLDCDLYQPTKAGLHCFWPNIVPGGVLLIHDYNAGYIGVKKAVDEFFEPLGIVPVPLCDKVGSAVVIKNRIL